VAFKLLCLVEGLPTHEDAFFGDGAVIYCWWGIYETGIGIGFPGLDEDELWWERNNASNTPRCPFCLRISVDDVEKWLY
jgi:hypothetical protein